MSYTIFDSMGRCGVRISQRLDIILQRGQVLWLRFGSRSIVFVSYLCTVSCPTLDVNLFALTNYAEYCHSFSNRIIGWSIGHYLTQTLVFPRNGCSPHRFSMHRPKHPSWGQCWRASHRSCAANGLIHRKTLASSPHLRSSGPDKYSMGLLGHPAYLPILLYGAGIISPYPGDPDRVAASSDAICINALGTPD